MQLWTKCNELARLRSANEDNTQFEMSQMSQVQLQFHINKLVWNIHNNSNSTDFSQTLYKQESLADAKVSARQQCVYEGL